MWLQSSIALLIYLTFELVSGLSNCKDVICGNAQLNAVPLEYPKVKIMVYSVWVGEPLEERPLNHKIYCDANGYEYRHFYYNRTTFDTKYTVNSGAWLSVFAAKELLATSDADYFFKMDLDCVFMRQDVRLESLLDPLQRYSFYTTNTEPTSRFMQSQSWILKNSNFSRAFISEWLDYVHWGQCGNLAYEQGAMHHTVGTFYKYHIGDNGTDFICPQKCEWIFNAIYYLYSDGLQIYL